MHALTVGSVVLFWVAASITLTLFSLTHSLGLKTGLTGALGTLASLEVSSLGGLSSASLPGQDSLFSADKDIDLFSSTDFEDLLVFTLDALELIWQDVNLVVDLCGDNLFALGVGALVGGSAFLYSRRVFFTKRFKR